MTVSKAKETETPPAKHTQCNEQVPTFGVSLRLHKKNALRFMAKSHQTSLSHDFSKMYTSIKLECVEEKTNQYANLMFEYQKQSGSRKDRGKEKVLLVKHKGIGSWRVKDDARQEDTASKKYVTAARLKK